MSFEKVPLFNTPKPKPQPVQLNKIINTGAVQKVKKRGKLQPRRVVVKAKKGKWLTLR
jgi:hypothetical protein